MPRSKYVTALDIGTTKICCVVGEPTERGLNIVGVGEAPSEGLRRGVVVNMEKTVRGITHAVDAAQRMCGHKLESAYVGMAGTHVLSQNSHGVIAVARSDREIGHEDVTRVIDAARAVSVPNDREIIHVVPRGYVVDGQEGVKDAIGMSGARLEVETHIITGSLTAVQNVVKCVHQAGMSVEDLVVQVLASAEAVLNDNELELGVALVDVGGGTTDVALFADGSVVHTAVLPVGATHITNDVAIGLRTSLGEAEMLKVNYGHAIPANIPREARRHLAEIIAPRAREILEMVRLEMRRGGHDGFLPGGIVFTGGGCRLLGFTEAAQSLLDLPVRIGSPAQTIGMSDQVGGPAYATAVGLLRWGTKLRHHANGHAPVGAGASALYARTVRWIKDFF
ncbi:MAG: cell division protein FtsA [Chloroflexi bacterium]|nr:MAG: cell division protein FtsA [Chloroflexota bacterium]